MTGISAGKISGLSPTYGNRFLGLWGPGGEGHRIRISFRDDRGAELKGLTRQLEINVILRIRDTHTHARKSSSENKGGGGCPPKGAAVCCLDVENGLRAGLCSLLPRMPWPGGGIQGGERKQLLFGVPSRLTASRGATSPSLSLKHNLAEATLVWGGGAAPLCLDNRSYLAYTSLFTAFWSIRVTQGGRERKGGREGRKAAERGRLAGSGPPSPRGGGAYCSKEHTGHVKKFSAFTCGFPPNPLSRV